MRSLRRWVTRLCNSLPGRIDNQRLKEEIEEHIALEISALDCRRMKHAAKPS
jgi:hypothetical protein